MLSRPRTVVAVAVGTGLLVAGVAWADTRSATDPADTDGKMDISRASAGHSADGRLRHVVTTRSGWGPRDLVERSGPPGGVCLHLWTRRRPSAGPPDYMVCANSDSRGRSLRGWVTRVSRRPARTGRSTRAAVSRPSSRSVIFRFGQSQIGRPSRYYWRAETVNYGEGCPKRTGCLDTVPNLAKTRSHRLAKPRAQARTPSG